MHFQIFFVLALLLIVYTWNSSPLRSNLLRLQCTCCTISWIYNLSMSSLECYVLCMVISLLVLRSIWINSSLVHFKIVPEYLTGWTAHVFIPLIMFLQYSFVSSSFLVLLRYSFLIFSGVSFQYPQVFVGFLFSAFRPSWMHRASVFEWHKRFKEGRESVRDNGRCGRSKKVNTSEMIGQRVRVRVTMLRFWGSSGRDSKGRGQHSSNRVSGIFHQDNAPVHNSILVTYYLTKMGIRTVPHPPCSPDLGPCDFWSFPKLRGCRYETIEEMKEAVTKVIDTLTQEDFHGALQKFLERYNECIAAEGDYFEGD